MFRLNQRVTVMGLAALLTLLLCITVAPTALAVEGDQEHVFDMNDRFAAEAGASGSGEAKVDGASIETEVEAEGLIPGHQYELRISIGPGNVSPVVAPLSVGCGPVTADNDGEAEFECESDINLVQLFGAGPYRIDLFITHIHPQDPGDPIGSNPALSAALDRDPLLACEPAVFVVVPGA